MHCINCGVEYEYKFCPECGEKLSIPNITFTSMFTSAIGTLSNMDKGFLFNVKSLLLSPKEFISLYINGKRKNIFNPISFLIISVTVYLVVSSLSKSPLIEFEFGDSAAKQSFEFGKKIGQESGYQAGKIIRENLKYFWILTVIWLSLSTKIFYRKFKFAEHLAINSLIIGIATLLGCVTHLLFKIPIVFDFLIYMSIGWMLFRIHRRKNELFEGIVKAGFSTVLFFIFLVIVTIVTFNILD